MWSGATPTLTADYLGVAENRSAFYFDADPVKRAVQNRQLAGETPVPPGRFA